MLEAPTLRQFFGDQEHAFALPAHLIVELERVTTTGIGGLARRVFAGQFTHAELLATIRLGLIGGGTDPEDAAALVAAYASPAPVMTAYSLAVAILETVMFGRPATDGGSDE